MTFFDFIDKVKFYAGRFLPPTIALVIGILLLRVALVPAIEMWDNGIRVIPIEVHQPKGFMIAAIFFIVASIVWFLFLLKVLRSFIGYLVMALMAAGSIFLLYIDYEEIETTVTFKNNFEKRDLEIKARMFDIKEAQLAYKEANGAYTDSMDELINFVKTGKKMKIKKKGSIPERKITAEERDYLYNDNRPIDNLMTEKEATLLAKSPLAGEEFEGFVRDTNYVPVMDAIFLDTNYVDNREKMGAKLAFNADSLRYVPYSQIPVKMDTSSIERNEVRIPTLYIEMMHPMTINSEDTLFYKIGDLNDNNLRESWD